MAIGKPVPPPLTKEERRRSKAAEDQLDAAIARFYSKKINRSTA